MKLSEDCNGLIKEIDENHSIAIAQSKDGKEKMIRIKCLAKDFIK